MAKVKLTPSEWAEKQGTRLKAALPEMQAGIERVTEAPGIAAAKAKDKMRQNLLKKLDDGTWEKNVAKVTVSEWKDAIITKGLPRIASGIDGARAKVTKFADQFGKHIDTAAATIDAMPTLNIQQSGAKMMAQMMHNSKFKFNK